METENIDLFVIIEKLWRRKKVIFAWMGGCLAVGIVLIFLLPRQYKAECMMQWYLPKDTEHLSPSLYQDLFCSEAFRQQLIHRPLYVADNGDTVTYFSALTGARPGMPAVDGAGVTSLSPEERMCAGRLLDEVSIAINHNGGYLTVMAVSRNPKMAAQLAEQARLLLQQAVLEEDVKQDRQAFAAIERRYLKMKEELQLRQQRLVDDLEKAASLPAVRREVEKKILMDEYDLFYSLYADCVCEYEKARIELQEERSVLTVIKPVAEPVSPFKPSPRMLVLAALFLGFLLGCGWALLVPERRR